MAKKANNPFARTLISNANMDPAQKFRIEEAYKSIRTNIMLSILKKGCKTIVVSSGSPAEGKNDDHHQPGHLHCPGRPAGAAY